MEKLTVESVKDFDSEVDYTTVLDNFEGPLDLLLYLINKEEIQIEDIFVSQVTEQFLTYMQGLPYLDMEKASEYLNIAATIILAILTLVPLPTSIWMTWRSSSDRCEYTSPIGATSLPDWFSRQSPI